MAVVEVSIVIAAWNAEAFIARALDSACAQRGVCLEVIVVDDASTDGTAALVAAHPDPRVRCLRLERNAGPSGARNAGFAAATGAWIAVLDADDTMEPGRLRRMTAKGYADAADLVVDNLLVEREGAAARSPASMFPAETIAAPGAFDVARFLASNRLFAGEFNFGYLKPLFRAGFVRANAIRYDEGLRIGEDYLFLAECLAAGARVAIDPTAGYRYFVRQGSISRRLRVADIDNMLAAERRFAARRAMTGDAGRAHRKRIAGLANARAFLLLLDRMKARDVAGSLAIVSRHPSAARHLWIPLLARSRRLFAGAAPPIVPGS